MCVLIYVFDMRFYEMCAGMVWSGILGMFQEGLGRGALIRLNKKKKGLTVTEELTTC